MFRHVVDVRFTFSGGAKALVVLGYNHAHATEGEWFTMSPFLGKPTKVGPPGVAGELGERGSFSLVGGVCSLKQKDESGKLVLAGEMRYFPKLGNVSEKEWEKGKFEGPIRIYRASQIMVPPTGVWDVVNAGSNIPDINLYTQHQSWQYTPDKW